MKIPNSILLFLVTSLFLGSIELNANPQANEENEELVDSKATNVSNDNARTVLEGVGILGLLALGATACYYRNCFLNEKRNHEFTSTSYGVVAMLNRFMMYIPCLYFRDSLPSDFKSLFILISNLGIIFDNVNLFCHTT